jgi:hypothetical protein
MDHCRSVLPTESSSRPPSVIDRAREFLDYWESEHVEAVPARQRGQEAVRLAELCRDDALRAGLALVDLQRAANGNLVQNMLDALEAAFRRDLD